MNLSYFFLYSIASVIVSIKFKLEILEGENYLENIFICFQINMGIFKLHIFYDDLLHKLEDNSLIHQFF